MPPVLESSLTVAMWYYLYHCGRICLCQGVCVFQPVDGNVWYFVVINQSNPQSERKNVWQKVSHKMKKKRSIGVLSSSSLESDCNSLFFVLFLFVFLYLYYFSLSVSCVLFLLLFSHSSFSPAFIPIHYQFICTRFPLWHICAYVWIWANVHPRVHVISHFEWFCFSGFRKSSILSHLLDFC